MNFHRIIFSQALRHLKIDDLQGGRVYGGQLNRIFEERYGFLEGPKRVEDFDLAKGITYRHGWFEKSIVIDRCQIFENGVVVESQAPVEACEQFLDDILHWLKVEIEIPVEAVASIPPGFFSQVEIFLDKKIADSFANFELIAELLSQKLQSYGQPKIPFEVTGISVHTEIGKISFPKPSAFTVARREGSEFQQNLYFSSAPLRTADHLNLLSDLEGVLI